MANRIMHPRYGTEREYAVRVLGEMDEAQRRSLVEGIELEDGLAAFGALDYLGGDGSNRWYRVTLQEGRNREVRRMFEAVGVTVSRLIRTRFGDIVLPRARRGRWDELDASLVTALMVQLGLLREDDDSGGGNRRRSKQPQSHDSALPPGFGTMDRNGMNGARIGRRGKLQRRPPGQRRPGRRLSLRSVRHRPDDRGRVRQRSSVGGRWGVDGNRRAASPAVAAPRRATRAGPGRAASPLAANPAASRAAIARLHPPSRARKRPTRRRRVVRPPALRAPGGEPAAPRRPASRRVRAAAVAAPRRPGPVAAATRPKGRARGQGAGGQAGKSAGQGGNKSRSSRGSAPRR